MGACSPISKSMRSELPRRHPARSMKAHNGTHHAAIPLTCIWQLSINCSATGARPGPGNVDGDYINRMNLRQIFDLSLVNRRDEPGLEWAGETYSFGQLDARSNRLAHALQARGLRAGDRLCVYLANRIEMIDLFLAAIKLGVIFVPVNILYREREVRHILSDAEPKLFVTEKDLAGLSSETEPAANFPHLDGDAPAALVYTSGTTGASKGAILSHNNFAANGVNLTACWQITERDRFLLAL